MDVHQLRVFASVFRQKSFSKASRELKLTQPTVSNHVMSLEKELGCKLFDRTGRRVIPTKEAEVLYLHALDLTEKLDGIPDAIRGVNRDVAGELVIGASTIPGTYILPAIAADFVKQYPGVSFEIRLGDTEEIANLVLNHEILLGTVGAKTVNGKLDYTPFVEDELVLAGSPQLIGRRSVSLKLLGSIPFLLREEGSGTRKVMEEYLAEKGFGVKDLNVVAVLGSTGAVREAIKAGLGASILSKFALTDEISAGRLAVARMEGLRMKRKFFVISHKKRTLPAHYRLFVGEMVRHG
ncbi:LysR family transcriptional regulator [bacterium]|nr:LysR family transcriptional regulator [bacterium]